MAKNTVVRDFIGIDLGSVNTMIYVAGLGVIFNEPTVIVFDRESNEVVAVGEVAYKMIGKTHEKLRVVYPIKNGVVVDDVALMAFFIYIFDKVKIADLISEMRVMVPTHPEASKVDLDTLQNVLERVGFTKIYFENKLKIGALGSGIDIYKANGSFIIDLGGESVSFGVVSLGDVVVSKSIPLGGRNIDHAIVRYIREKYNTLIHINDAEKIKWIASLYLVHENRVFDVSGLDLIEERPKQIQVTTSELKYVLISILQEIVEAAKEVFGKTPPSLVADIMKSGIMLTGGTALLEGIQEYIQNSLGVETRVSRNPMLAMLEGTRLYEPHLLPYDDIKEDDEEEES